MGSLASVWTRLVESTQYLVSLLLTASKRFVSKSNATCKWLVSLLYRFDFVFLFPFLVFHYQFFFLQRLSRELRITVFCQGIFIKELLNWGII